MGWKIKAARRQNDGDEMNTDEWWKWWWLMINDLNEWDFFINSSF